MGDPKPTSNEQDSMMAERMELFEKMSLQHRKLDLRIREAEVNIAMFEVSAKRDETIRNNTALNEQVNVLKSEVTVARLMAEETRRELLTLRNAITGTKTEINSA